MLWGQFPLLYNIDPSLRISRGDKECMYLQKDFTILKFNAYSHIFAFGSDENCVELEVTSGWSMNFMAFDKCSRLS